jgi:hypothetical protein
MVSFPEKYKVVIEVFALGILNGVIEKQQIIDWADNIIRNENEPDFFILELSLINTKSNSDILSLLNEYREESIYIISARAYMAMVYHKLLNGQLELQQVVNAIYALVPSELISGYEEGRIYTMEYENDSIDNGYFNITAEEVKTNAIEFLSLYREFSMDNIPDWGKINTEVELKLVLLEKENEIKTKEFQIKHAPKTPWWKFW